MDKSSIIDFIKNSFSDYFRLTLQRIEDKVIDRISGIISTVLGLIFLLFTFSLFFIFSTVALALFLGSVLGSSYWGFLIISIFYLIAGVVLWIFKKELIKKPIARILRNAIKDELPE